MKRLRWGDEPLRTPLRPYRDSALVYLGFAVLIVVIATATGGGFVRAVVVAVFFWLAATGYSWLRWRRRLGEERRRP
ncbi:MAG TPA: hypothetical protein VFI37_03675 [Gaiellaceae bacterium]|nr:hypothetical protein [Gaiellaceae bacterium]